MLGAEPGSFLQEQLLATESFSPALPFWLIKKCVSELLLVYVKPFAFLNLFFICVCVCAYLSYAHCVCAGALRGQKQN